MYFQILVEIDKNNLLEELARVLCPKNLFYVSKIRFDRWERGSVVIEFVNQLVCKAKCIISFAGRMSFASVSDFSVLVSLISY